MLFTIVIKIVIPFQILDCKNYFILFKHIFYILYKKYGAGSIPYLNYDGAEIFNINNSDKEAINLVIKKLSKYSVYDLVEATHKQGPWESVYDKNTRSAIISKESIKDYFNA